MKNNTPQKNIPDGWDMIPAGDVFSFVKTFAFSRENLCDGDLENGDVGNIHYGDIHSTFASPSIDLNKVKIPAIRDRRFMPEQSAFLKDGDLVMADASEDYEGVGVTVSIHGIGKKKAVGGLHTFVLRDNKHQTDEYFRQYIFCNPVVRNALQKVANGVSVYGISKTAVSKMRLPIPPLTEQKRIADVLKTWDRAIHTLGAEIAAKKEAKRGLMQELLTGRTRLSGFNDKWRVITLGEIFRERNERETESNDLLLYSLTIEDGVCPKSERYNRSFLVKSEEKAYKKTYQDDIVYNPANLRYGAIARNKNIKPVLLSPIYQVLFVKNKNEYNIDFFDQLLTWDRQIRKMSAYAEGTLIERMEVKIDSFKIIQLDIPSFAEQSAIAKILMTADSEIAQLEQKLAFIQDQKRYLLNNLITGAIRVPGTKSKVGKGKSTAVTAR